METLFYLYGIGWLVVFIILLVRINTRSQAAIQQCYQWLAVITCMLFLITVKITMIALHT